ncbi:hypothetical protein, conserved [Leishmania tarentolae]|uniref:Exocyst complex component Sec10-like alpha-helical bundle domain-containing protein n=1 Tax=Leishmania tarentolae TaxID=5689 RepID=A0A640KI45_LEITA|nr:hypothetical protein, conserved [Leishmania tarentolae]
MERDVNEQPRRHRRLLRSEVARQQRQDESGYREMEFAAAPLVQRAPSVADPQGPAPVARAPATRLASPTPVPGASPRAAGAGTPRKSKPDPQVATAAPRGGCVSGAEAFTACNNSSSAPASRAATAASSPESTPALAGMPAAADRAMEPVTSERRIMVDRSLFSTIAFSSPLFVNNISQRVLYPVLQRHRAEQKRLVTIGGPGGRDGSSGGGEGTRGTGSAVGGTRVESGAAQLLASDGTPLFGSSRMPISMRARVDAALNKRFGTNTDKPPGGGAANVDFVALAGHLTSTLEEASEEVRRLLEEEEALLHREEVRCKRVEIREKRRLATVRLGLEGTSARLQQYENRVSNAQAATAGIEQHLANSNARVQRGKVVSQMLRYFKMLTSISTSDLRALLEAISATRKTQRAAVTTRWAAGHVSAFRPRFYTTVISTASSIGTRAVLTSSRAAGVVGGLEGDDDAGAAKRSAPATAAAADADAYPGRTTRRPRVFRSNARRRSPAVNSDVSPRSQVRSFSSQQSPQLSPRALTGSDMAGDDDSRAVRVQSGSGGDAVAPLREDTQDEVEDDEKAAAAMEDGGDGTDGDAIVDLTQVRMQRAEAAAVAAGLDRLFALRFCTEAQVQWCQRLMLLANELGDAASNVKNVRLYVDWLRKELVSDLFHVVTCFNDFYDEDPQTAVYQAYGRALLKTLGRISSLYNTLTTSNDELLSLFFSRSINDLGVVLFSEWSPTPLPGLPPLPQSSELRAMDHYRQHTDKELRRAFRFLIDRIRRNVIVVETIFGTTNTARQQLLSRVTDGVVRPFLNQQIKLAETQATSMVQAEGSLTPRTKRRCGVRVADIIAYHHTMETRMYSFYQEYMKELKNIFSASQVEFLGRFVDVIFAQRSAYSVQRTELELLSRYFTLIEERYTRSLHPIPDEFFDLREAHMTKMKEVITCLTEVAGRVKTYALPKDVGPYVRDLIKTTLVYVGNYLDAELCKVLDSLRNDRDNWRVKPKSEDELLQPLRMEPQQCAIRMLLFAQSSLMTLSGTTNAICVPLLQQYPRLMQDVEEARSSALEAVDERSERVLNMCVQAIVLRSLSILQHYQLKSDYLPKADSKKDDADTVAPPCTRACTLFCYYITRQFDMASEFIRLSNGQVYQRQMSSQMATGSVFGAAVQQHPASWAAATNTVSATGGAASMLEPAISPSANGAFNTSPTSSVSAVRARARTMNLQQLLYGDGGPSSFVRTLGVCLYRGISAHLKSFAANDCGALVYKQDVTAYKEAMTPLTSTPGLGGAVVEVLFQMLKETSSLLLVPLDHIREVKESGYLKLMSSEEKLRYLRIRQDVRSVMKIILE